jgi:hypothetical protein
MDRPPSRECHRAPSPVIGPANSIPMILVSKGSAPSLNPSPSQENHENSSHAILPSQQKGLRPSGTHDDAMNSTQCPSRTNTQEFLIFSLSTAPPSQLRTTKRSQLTPLFATKSSRQSQFESHPSHGRHDPDAGPTGRQHFPNLDNEPNCPPVHSTPGPPVHRA